MTRFGLRRRLVARPAWGCAAVAFFFRLAMLAQSWTTNELVRDPVLDGTVYLRWAREIAQGDVLGRRGAAAGEPWLLNPLYAYVLAPFAAIFASPLLPVLVAQAILGAGAAALTAGAASRMFGRSAASRTFGRSAAWTAGLLVTFAMPLAQLDAHVAVAELAAFLVAGACFACAPALPDDRPSAHGPVAAGLWLGLGALARPITPLALPFVAWHLARRSGRPLRTAVTVVAVFAACALPSLLRNWTVSGEPVVYTASGGVNAYIANNEASRTFRGMTAPGIRFHPVWMHEDAKAEVARALEHDPTRSEISSWYWRRTIDAAVAEPLATASHLFHKARWMLSPTEIPSSASLAVDLVSTPRLAMAFVPAWLIVSLGVAGLWMQRRRADVLLGVGAVALAHWAVLTVVFPLSHYRAPALPAFAVLAGGAIAAVLAAPEGRRARALTWTLVVAVAAAIAGAVDPRPDSLRSRDFLVVGSRALDAGRLEEAEAHARAAIDAVHEDRGPDVEHPLAWTFLGDVLLARGRLVESRTALDRALSLDPSDAMALVARSRLSERMGDLRAAERDARTATELRPNHGPGWRRLADVLASVPGRAAEADAARRRAASLP
ncbi:MAG: tetratricopeptide repeat protein [Planctomycetes bacterium]|nr:tetratricopeptide repeat protein [Planctomycetota bacterium]